MVPPLDQAGIRPQTKLGQCWGVLRLWLRKEEEDYVLDQPLRFGVFLWQIVGKELWLACCPPHLTVLQRVWGSSAHPFPKGEEGGSTINATEFLIN